MGTKELGELRHRYKEAYTNYMSCVRALSEASLRGVWPTAEIRDKEQKAYNELAFARQALLDGLYMYSRTPRDSS